MLPRRAVVAASTSAYGRASVAPRWARGAEAWNGGSQGGRCGGATPVTPAIALWEKPVVPAGKRLFAAFAALLLIAATASQTVAQQQSILVFAAASMKNSLDEANSAFTKQGGPKVVASYAASSALMKQIEQGAPADVFLSADIDWMDYGAKHGLIKNDTRFDLLGNQLVLIAPKDSTIGQVNIGPGFNLAALAGSGRIAVGDVRAVPAGLYAKAALEKLGAWAAVEPKLAMAESVRAALVLVSRGEAPLGIVYETDAKIDPAVKIVGMFPPDSHPPIVYPVALTIGAKPDAASYLMFLRTQQARAIFERYGFNVLVKPTN
jgi:molybdate transport system substrate-binding protein